jgi:hypothetical protein
LRALPPDIAFRFVRTRQRLCRDLHDVWIDLPLRRTPRRRYETQTQRGQQTFVCHVDTSLPGACHISWTAALMWCFIGIKESSERAENLPILFAVAQRAT